MTTHPADPQLALEAKAIVALAFRNSPIEGVHAGKTCPTCAAVPEYSRITDDEIKAIMKSAVSRMYTLLRLKRATLTATPDRLLSARVAPRIGMSPKNGRLARCRRLEPTREFNTTGVGHRQYRATRYAKISKLQSSRAAGSFRSDPNNLELSCREQAAVGPVPRN